MEAASFTGTAFTVTLAAIRVGISMGGRGRWMNNVFIERRWRSHMAVWRDGTSGPLNNTTVDMMDNPRALPTCPQAKQQQTFAMVK